MFSALIVAALAIIIMLVGFVTNSKSLADKGEQALSKSADKLLGD